MDTFAGHVITATAHDTRTGSATIHRVFVDGVKIAERKSATRRYNYAWVRRSPGSTHGYTVHGWSGTSDRPLRDCFAVAVAHA